MKKENSNLCIHAECGGCSLRVHEYDKQLSIKKDFVLASLRKVDFFCEDLENKLEIIPSDNIDFYRNKMEFSFGLDENGKITLGFHKIKSYYDVVNLEECFMQSNKTKIILEICRDWANNNALTVYNKKTHEGLLRYLIIRHSKSNNGFLLNLVMTDYFHINDFIKELLSKDIDIRSFYISIKKDISDTAFTNERKLVFGDHILEEKIEDIRYKIGPYSFFQVNTKQIEKMYFLVKNWFVKGELLIDLYSGVGGFSIYLADIFDRVLGIESDEEAISLANQNKIINSKQNCEFICGKVENILDQELANNAKEICMILDPPRVGLGKKTIKKIISLLPNRLVYVSCNPVSVASDLELLGKIYDIIDVKILDMFPHTQHVETIFFLKLKQNIDLYPYLGKRKRSSLNMFNIAEFKTDKNGLVLSGNNTFFNFVEKFVRKKENINIFEIFKNKNIVKTFKFKEGYYKDITRFFDSTYGLALFTVFENSQENLFIFELSFERNKDEITGLIKDSTLTDENILDFFKLGLFSNLKSNVIIADENWKIEYVNEYFLENMAYSSQEVLGFYLEDINHSLNFKNLIKNIEEDLYQKKIWNGEFIFRSKVNKVCYYYTTIFLLKNKTTKFLILQNDITENFILERNLLDKTNQVNKIMNEIHNLDYFFTKKDKLNFKKNLEKIELDFENKNLSNISIKECYIKFEELENKIKNLKNSFFTNIAENQVNMMYCDLTIIFEEELKKLEDKFKEKHIKLNYSYNAFSNYVYIDKDLFKKMLLNLLNNAINFAPFSSTIYIKTFQKTGFFNIQIIDEGPGVAPDIQRQIFTELNIEKMSSLIISKNIVEAHNGSISIESPSTSIGKGTEFLVKLPIEKREYYRY